MTDSIRPEDVLSFWFSDQMIPNHFRKDPDIDRAITDQFMAAYEDAVAGRLGGWTDDALGSLALVITLDQFPRNMFRDSPRAFAADDQALAAADAAITRGFDDALTQDQRVFLYMPFMHTESRVGQDRSVELYEKLGIETNLSFARAHRDVIVEFGRFPHRNAVLGRPSTPEEEVYLSDPDAGF